MRTLALQEYCSVSGGETQTFDDGTTLTTDESGNITGYTDIEGSSWEIMGSIDVSGTRDYSAVCTTLGAGAGLATGLLAGGACLAAITFLTAGTGAAVGVFGCGALGTVVSFGVGTRVTRGCNDSAQ